MNQLQDPALSKVSGRPLFCSAQRDFEQQQQ
jgi:hypothetical protein